MVDADTSAQTADHLHVLEEGKRLSQSMLWKLQRQYFAREGVEAWRQGIVPHYVTSNTYIAQAYARVVFGFLRDCASAASDQFAPLDSKQPLYVVELGAGSGRFSYHFLKKFHASLQSSALKNVAVQYVLTDFSEQMIDYWRNHAWLKPLMEDGYLDFARFDAEHDQTLTLEHSGVTLTVGSVMNPMVVIGNYFFDSIPQDAFHFESNEIYESLVTLLVDQPEPDLDDPTLLSRLIIEYEHELITGDYYGDPEFDRILNDYRQQLSSTHLVFPYSGLLCLRNLIKLAGNRLLLLSGDKGYGREEDLINRSEEEVIIHGSFSMVVNYHALGQYVLHQGGTFLQTPHRHISLDICAFLLGHHPADYVETRMAYAEAIEKGGPDDFFTLKKGIEKHYESLTLDHLLALLRLSGWDSKIFLDSYAAIATAMRSASEQLCQEMYWALYQIWDNYFPIGDKPDLPFMIGMLLFSLKRYPEAIEFYERSAEIHGLDAITACNMGLAYYELRRLDEALLCANQALEIDATFEPAKAMRIKIQSQLQREKSRSSRAINGKR